MVPTAKLLAPLWGPWRERRIREVGVTDRVGQDATNGCVGSGKRICYLYQIPGAPEALGWTPPFPGRPKVSYGHIRQPETETTTHCPARAWHLARACSDLLPEGTFMKHLLCAWHRGSHSTSVLPKGEAVIPIVQMRPLRLQAVM